MLHTITTGRNKLMKTKDNMVVGLQTGALAVLVVFSLAALSVSAGYGLGTILAPGLLPQVTIAISYPLFLLALVWLSINAV